MSNPTTPYPFVENEFYVGRLTKVDPLECEPRKGDTLFKLVFDLTAKVDGSEPEGNRVRQYANFDSKLRAISSFEKMLTSSKHGCLETKNDLQHFLQKDFLFQFGKPRDNHFHLMTYISSDYEIAIPTLEVIDTGNKYELIYKEPNQLPLKATTSKRIGLRNLLEILNAFPLSVPALRLDQLSNTTDKQFAIARHTDDLYQEFNSSAFHQPMLDSDGIRSSLKCVIKNIQQIETMNGATTSFQFQDLFEETQKILECLKESLHWKYSARITAIQTAFMQFDSKKLVELVCDLQKNKPIGKPFHSDENLQVDRVRKGLEDYFKFVRNQSNDLAVILKKIIARENNEFKALKKIKVVRIS